MNNKYNNYLTVSSTFQLSTSMLFQQFIPPHHALGRYLSPVCFIGTATGSQGSCMPGFKSESPSVTAKNTARSFCLITAQWSCGFSCWLNFCKKKCQERLKMVVLPSCTLPFLCQEKFIHIPKDTPVSHATI